MKKILILITVTTLVLACSNKEKSYLTVQSNIRYNRLILEVLHDDFQPFDTAQFTVDKGWDFYATSVPQGVFRLVGEGKPIFKFVNEGETPAFINIIQEGEDYTIQAYENLAILELWRIERLVLQLEKEVRKNAQKLNANTSRRQFNAMKDTVFKSRDEAFSKCREKLLQQYKLHSGSLLQIPILLQESLGEPIFHPQEYINLYILSAKELTKKYPNNVYVRKFKTKTDSLQKYVNYIRPTTKGEVLPNLALTSASGKTLEMDFFSGKKRLVVVWSSNDEKSRKVTKQLMRVTRPARHKGMEIVMISVDTLQQEWGNAIKEDYLPLWHFCDTLGSNSTTMQHLGVTSLPLMVLAGENDTIIERCNDLEGLEEILGKI